MNIIHYMKREDSGLARCTLELSKYEEMQGHTVCVKEPNADTTISGHSGDIDVHCVHSQLSIDSFFDNKPKFMWMHGEPLSSVGNGVSMKAICDLSPKIDAFLAMRKEEVPIWSSIKRTWYVPKGIDLEVYKPLGGVTERLEGEPAVLYYENWRGSRNPLYLCKAMELVHQKLPNARLHLYNCRDSKMKATFEALIRQCKWWPFLRSLKEPVDDVNLLINRVDIVVSCLFPLYARSIEAFGAGRALICPGYREHDYPFTCELSPESLADAIVKCWENYGSVNYREWAEKHHDVNETVRQAVDIYKRYM